MYHSPNPLQHLSTRKWNSKFFGAPIWVSGRPSSVHDVGCLAWKELGWMHICVCVCVSVCVRAHHTSSHLVDDEKREDPPPFRMLWHVHAPPSSRWVSVCLFHAKLLTRLTEIPLSLPPVPSAACCFSFYCWIYAPSSVISFGLTQIFGSCHLVPICWTNKPNARHDSRPNSGSRSIVNNFLLPDSSSSHCSICVAGYSQLISIFKKISGFFYRIPINGK